MQVGQIPLVEPLDEMTERSLGCVIAHAHESSHRRQPHTDPFSTYFFSDRRYHLQQKACAILNAAAVIVFALVTVAVKELIEQITISGMDFHAVHAGIQRVARRSRYRYPFHRR